MILNELNLNQVSKETDLSLIRELISKAFWVWYSSNQDRKLTVVRVWFISKSIYVKDLKSVFELLFGPSQS